MFIDFAKPYNVFPQIKEQILLEEIIDAFPDKIESGNVVSMEQLPINDNSGKKIA